MCNTRQAFCCDSETRNASKRVAQRNRSEHVVTAAADQTEMKRLSDAEQGEGRRNAMWQRHAGNSGDKQRINVETRDSARMSDDAQPSSSHRCQLGPRHLNAACKKRKVAFIAETRES